MLDLRLLRNNFEKVEQHLKRRGQAFDLKSVLDLDEQHRSLLKTLQEAQSRRHVIAKEYGAARQKGLDCTHLTHEGEDIKHKISELEAQVGHLATQIRDKLSWLPNIPSVDCPDGLDETKNVEVRQVGVLPVFSFSPRSHDELGEKLNLMDFKRAAKLSGSRFVILYGALARLERALAQFMLNTHTQDFGYQEVHVPLLVKDTALFGTGQHPKFCEDQFQTTDGRWLIPTAEVALTNLLADEIVDEKDLPARYVAYTPCFRLEAGAAGKDTRGMIRQHQFTKVELVSLCHPHASIVEHEHMVHAAETILQKLGLAYRVVDLCTGDLGFTAEKTYDIEVWIPSQNTYREISSCSRCGDFQARRMKSRYRSINDGHINFLHTLNGSGVAVGRALVAVLENYQQEDGSIRIPDVLIPYMDGLTAISPS